MELSGKNILFLGSSVTYGSTAGGVSFADILCKQLGANCIKDPAQTKAAIRFILENGIYTLESSKKA